MNRDESISVQFFPNAKGSPAGHLADAEVLWTEGPFAGLRLCGFGIWERRAGGRNLTMPARQYSVNGERRSYALLRPQIGADASAQDRMREWILDEYRHYEETIAILAAEEAKKQQPTPAPFYTETITHDTTTPAGIDAGLDRLFPLQPTPDVKRYDNADDAAAAARRGEPICITDLINKRTSPAVAADIQHEQRIRERLTARTTPPADGIRF